MFENSIRNYDRQEVIQMLESVLEATGTDNNPFVKVGKVVREEMLGDTHPYQAYVAHLTAIYGDGNQVDISDERASVLIQCHFRNVRKTETTEMIEVDESTEPEYRFKFNWEIWEKDPNVSDNYLNRWESNSVIKKLHEGISLDPNQFEARLHGLTTTKTGNKGIPYTKVRNSSF